MYSPLADFRSMWLTPVYIVFRATIDGQERYGRFKDASLDSFGKIKFGTFESHISLVNIQTGLPGEDIIVNRANFIALQAYDISSTTTPSEFNRILTCCQAISEMRTVNENTPVSLIAMTDALQDFIDLHVDAREEGLKVISKLTELRIKLSNEEHNQENAQKIIATTDSCIAQFFMMIAVS